MQRKMAYVYPKDEWYNALSTIEKQYIQKKGLKWEQSTQMSNNRLEEEGGKTTRSVLRPITPTSLKFANAQWGRLSYVGKLQSD